MFHLILNNFNDGHQCPSNIFNFMEENMTTVIVLYDDISKYGKYTVFRNVHMFDLYMHLTENFDAKLLNSRDEDVISINKSSEFSDFDTLKDLLYEADTIIMCEDWKQSDYYNTANKTIEELKSVKNINILYEEDLHKLCLNKIKENPKSSNIYYDFLFGIWPYDESTFELDKELYVRIGIKTYEELVKHMEGNIQDENFKT